MTKRFATVCSGIGAPEVAWTRLSWRPVFASEIEAFPNAVREHHFPGVPNLGDMTRFRDWPDRCRCKSPKFQNPNSKEENEYRCSHCGGIRIDVLAGGTPCQSFSIAGLRAGLADPRGNLALTFLAIVERYAPRWVLWENVPGVHSSWSDAAKVAASEETRLAAQEARRLARAGGFDTDTANLFGDFEEVDQSNDFDCFASGLEQLGYGIAMRITDAQYFRVAQRRRRVFVVGHLGGEWQRTAAVLFDTESLRGNPPPRRETGKGTAPTISARVKGGGGLGTDFDCDGGLVQGEEICATLTKNYGTHHGRTAGANGGIAKGQLRVVGIDSENNPHEDLMGPLKHLSPNGGGHPAAVAIGIDGSEVGYALRSEPSHSGDKGDGGVNTTLVAEVSSSVTSKWAKSSGGPSGDECQNLIATDVSPTLRSGGNKTGGDRPPGTDVDTPDSLVAIPIQEIGKRQSGTPMNGVGHGDPGDPMFTLQSAAHHGIAQAMAVRRLTPRECERLQGFPDDYTLVKFRGKPACDGPRYKAIGNSMAVPNIEWLGRRIDLVDELVPWKQAV